MHWSPEPDVMYSKAQWDPKLSLLSINWPIFVQKCGKICSKSVKMGVRFQKS